MTHDPIQAKQSWSIGRNVIDNFETAIRRDGGYRGYVVAFSFGTGAKKEAARARVQEKANIQLITVEELLNMKPQTGPLFPLGGTVAQLPLGQLAQSAPLEAPKKRNLPTFNELVESSKAAETA